MENTKKVIHVNISIRDIAIFGSGAAVGAAVMGLTKTDNPEDIIVPLIKGVATIVGYRVVYSIITGK